jgi:hypothetical protein
MDGTLFWVFASLAAFIVGASKGGVPGVGILAVPVLAQIISPVVAAGLLLPLLVLSDFYGLWLYRKNYDLWNIKIMVFASTIGIVIGWATARYNSDDLVKLLVGVIGIWYSIDLYLKSRRSNEPKPADVPRGLFWGTLRLHQFCRPCWRHTIPNVCVAATPRQNDLCWHRHNHLRHRQRAQTSALLVPWPDQFDQFGEMFISRTNCHVWRMGRIQTHQNPARKNLLQGRRNRAVLGFDQTDLGRAGASSLRQSTQCFTC